jgi:monoamine oxidase
MDLSNLPEIAIDSLSKTFKVDKEEIRKNLLALKVVNWAADVYARGAYSYWTPESTKAYKELSTPVDNKIFFAGEALFSGHETATVEGALASGKETAEKILSLSQV